MAGSSGQPPYCPSDVIVSQSCMTVEEALLRAQLNAANGGAAGGGAANGGGSASGGAHSDPPAQGGAGGANAECPELNEGPLLHGPVVRMGVLCCYVSTLYCG